MTRIEILDPRESDDPDVREFAPKVTFGDRLSYHFGAETHFPEVMMHVYEARLALMRQGELGPRLFNKLAVAISMANECQFCTGAFSNQLSRQLGGHEAVREYQQAVRESDLQGFEADVVDFALTILDDPSEISDEDFECFRTEHDFTDRTFIEVIYIVNIISGYNRLTVTLDLPYEFDYPEEWADEAAAPMKE